MRRLLILYNTILLIGYLVIGCRDEGVKTVDDQQIQNFGGQLISHTDCKKFQKSVFLIDSMDTLSCIEYFYDQVNHKLTLKHVNAGFNCCPESLYCLIGLQNDTIIVKEHEKISACHCCCLFDLNIQITGITAKRYFLKILEPYCGDQDKLFFGIDLSLAQQGNYCVKRTNYPWGN